MYKEVIDVCMFLLEYSKRRNSFISVKNNT